MLMLINPSGEQTASVHTVANFRT